VLPDTDANRRRGVVGCTQTSSGINCSNRRSGGGSYQRRGRNTDGIGSDKANSKILTDAGIFAFEAKDDFEAAMLLGSAIEHNRSNRSARQWYSLSLNRIGSAAYKRSDFASALLYFERALDADNLDFIRSNLKNTKKTLNYTGKSCGLCQKALMSDLDYGLQFSAKFSNYGRQSISNYYNCTRRLSGCENTTGGRLNRIMKETCQKFGNSRSYASCAATALRGARLE